MRFLSRLTTAAAALLLLAAAPVFAQTNYTTNITLASLKASGGAVPYATVCAYPADIYGNPISVSATNWGLILAGTPAGCGSVVSGALTAPIPVPDAYHTNASGPIYYNLSIQQTNSSGTATNQAIFFKAVSNVTGTNWALDTYAPTANVPVPPSAVLTVASAVPGSCTAPSIYLPSSSSTQPAYCQAGVYVAFASSGPGSASSFSAYSGSTTYAAGQVVLYTNNIGYIAIQSTTGNLPTNTTYWTPLWASPGEPIGTAAGAAAATNAANLATESTARVAISTQLGSSALVGIRKANTTSPDTVASASDIVSTLGSTAVGFATSLASQMSTGLSYYIKWQEGSGTTSADATGNGHTATISGSGTAYAWQPGAGIALNGYTASIPNAAGYPSFGYCAYFPPGTTSAFTLYSYVGAATVSTYPGFAVTGVYGATYGHGFLAYYPAFNSIGGSPALASAVGITGNHCLEFILGTGTGANVGHIYVDGVETTYAVQNYTTATETAAQLSNPITLSASLTNGTFPSPPVIYSNWGSATSDTPALAAYRTAYEVNRLAALGVTFGLPSNSQTTANNCYFDGTSIDQGYEASGTPTSGSLSLDFTCTISDYSISGQTPEDMYFAFPTRGAVTFAPHAVKNIAWNGGVTNGVMNDGESVANALADEIAWSRAVRAKGYKSIGTTMISRGCNGSGANSSSTGDQLAQAYNALLLANADEFDWLSNLAAVPALGATGASQNSTYFNSDSGCGTHPNTTGQAYYIAAERCAFEGAYGKPITNVGANYTQVCSDRLINDTASSAVTVTLIDANYESFSKSGKLCFKNSGTSTLTVSPVSGETIDGASSLSIASLADACIIPNVASAAAGGANWIKTQP